jgi:hypothetical protein
MAQQLSTLAGRVHGKDAIGQGASKHNYIGDPSTATGTATKIALTSSYRDATDIDSSKPAVIDLYDFDTMVGIVDYTKSAGTALRIKVSFGEDDDRTLLNMQEARRDDASYANEVRYELVEHVFTATYRGFIEVPRQSRYCKIEVKSDGSPDANDKVAVALWGAKIGK